MNAARIATRITKPRSIVSITLILLIIAFLVWLWTFVHNPEKFPIRTVKVMGEYQQTDKEKIQSIVAPLVAKGLFSVNITQIKQQLLALPWTQSAVVERLWPDELMIKLAEKKERFFIQSFQHSHKIYQCFLGQMGSKMTY
jgi:cell division septal protein FtsQ